MYIALIILHVVLCIVLIVTILLQAGKGGGLTEMFGGDTAQSVLGTQAPALLKKITEASAVGFIVTSLALGMVTARRGHSLFEGQTLPYFPSESSAALPFLPDEAIPENEGEMVLPPIGPIDIPEVPGTSAGSAETPLSTDDISGYDAIPEPEQEDLFIPEEQN